MADNLAAQKAAYEAQRSAEVDGSIAGGGVAPTFGSVQSFSRAQEVAAKKVAASLDAAAKKAQMPIASAGKRGTKGKQG